MIFTIFTNNFKTKQEKDDISFL